jgi:hypothetical protein
MGGNTNNSVIKATNFGTSPSGSIWTSPITQPPSGTLNGIIGIVSDGSFIATTQYYSLNNSASWTSWRNQSFQQKYFPPGLKGSIAYSTVSKRAFNFIVGIEGKANTYVLLPATISRTGSYVSSPNFGIGSSLIVSNCTYSPALNYFYINCFGSSANQYRYIDAASPGSAGTTSLGGTAGYRPGISSDGYPLVPLNVFGITFELRKYTSADLSTYTNLGTISGDGYYGFTAQSPWLYYPINDKYLFAAGSGGSIAVRATTVASPTAVNVIGTFSVGSSAILSIGISEDATGKLICAGMAQYTEPKGGIIISTFSYISYDGAVTWTNNLSAVLGASKNFS